MLIKQMKLKYYEFRSAAHEYQRDQWVLMQNYWHQFEGPFQIVKIKPHKTVEIKMHQKANIFAHVKNLKPYHVSTNFQTFHHNLQKQGGDTNYFDDQEDKEKFEKSDMKNTQKTQKPREEFKDEKDQTDEDTSDSDSKDDDFQKTIS